MTNEQTKMIGPRVHTPAPGAIGTTRSNRLPDDLVTEQVRRLAVTSAVGAGLWTFGLVMDSVVTPLTIKTAVSVTNIVRGPFRSANLGYAVAREVNGRGITTHAVGEVCRWAFTEAGLHRLEAGTLLDNHASQRVLAKNGFEQIGIARNYLFIDGEWRDHILFQRVAGA